MLNFMRENKKSFATFVSLFLGLNFSQPLFAAGEEKKEIEENNAYSRAAKFYLPSLVEQQKKEADAVEAAKKEFEKKSIKEKGAAKYKLPEPGNYESLNNVYVSFSRYAEALAKKEGKLSKGAKSLLSDNVLGDLEIFCGSNKKFLRRSLAERLDKTCTFWGKLVWQSFFTQGFDNFENYMRSVERRKKIVMTLVKNEELFDSIDQVLKIIEQCGKDVAFFAKALEGYTVATFEKELYFGSLIKSFASWNERSLPLNFNIFINHVSFYGPLLFFGSIPFNMVMSVKDCETKIKLPVAIAFGVLMMGLIYGFLFATTGDPCIFSRGLINAIHSKVNNLANVVNEMNDLSSIIENDRVLKDLFENYKYLQENPDIKLDAVEYNKLLEELKKDTFKGEPSFFSNKGRVLACFKKIQRLYDQFVPAFQVVGEIDACMSIAKIYKKFANHPNVKFCFPEFVKADQPYINIQDFWHPFLDPRKAVPNSIEFGTQELGHNVILTGPNAGGKSSSLKGIILSIILAQTLGIAPASKMVLTPFTRIDSHLNISDDVGRESLYQVEKNRVKGFLNDLKQLRKGEFEFEIMDEMFSSTNPEEGQSASYAIAKSLVKVPNCMCLLATHFKKLTELEEDTNGYYKNYKVYVDVQPDGTFKCPYKFIPGISNQNIAILMMENEFDSDIVGEAYDVLSTIKEDTSEIIGFKQHDAKGHKSGISD